MPVVLLINPNTSLDSTAMMARLLQQALPAGVELRCATAAHGVPMITTEAELAAAAAEVLRLGLAQAHTVDAIVIAAFGNPGIEALRAGVAVPVIGLGEASMQEAAAGGRRFGVATTTPGLADSIAHSAAQLGLGALFTGTRIPAAVDPLALAANPALQEACLAQAVQACMADGAGAVVIGGGPLAEAAERLGPRFAVPVISAVAAAGRAAAALFTAIPFKVL
ncbi:aspartate/glutamate racemase family protein [Xylophilus sp. GW821-FHT01B05]